MQVPSRLAVDKPVEVAGRAAKVLHDEVAGVLVWQAGLTRHLRRACRWGRDALAGLELATTHMSKARPPPHGYQVLHMWFVHVTESSSTWATACSRASVQA